MKRLRVGAPESDFKMTSTSVVVMEKGSDWLGPTGHAANVVLFGDESAELLRRTREKLGALRRTNHRVDTAVLACNSSTSRRASEERTCLARTLLGAFTGAVPGRLVLSAGGGASSRLRRDLLALLGTLTEERIAPTVTVSLRFLAQSKATH